MATQGFTVTPTPQDVVTAVPLTRNVTYQLQNRSPRSIYVWQEDTALADPTTLLGMEGDAGRVQPQGSGEYETVYLLADTPIMELYMWSPDGEARVSIVEAVK